MSDEFQKIQLGMLADIIMGQSPDSINYNDDEKGLAFLQGCADFGFRYPNPQTYVHPPLKLAKKNSVLVSVRAPVGKINWSDRDYCIGRGLCSVKAKKNNADTSFLKYALIQNEKFLHRRSQGSTFLAISFNDLSIFPVPDITVNAQKKIALILETIDQAIEKTEALIQKYQHIKQGLMHDLFTRGVTPDGKLRLARKQAPELYKETPIGWIPKEWSWTKCEQLCDRICVGIVIRPADYYVSEGVPTLRSANIREDGIEGTDLVYISNSSNLLLAKSQIRTGDILTVRTGYPGTSAVAPEEFNNCNCVDILISTPNGAIDSSFLCYWINSPFGKGQVLKKQGGLAQQHFNVMEMRNVISVLPDQSEQTRIVNGLDNVSSKISSEVKLLKKLQLKKSGLMHDLLTGKVRVKADE